MAAPSSEKKQKNEVKFDKTGICQLYPYQCDSASSKWTLQKLPVYVEKSTKEKQKDIDKQEEKAADATEQTDAAPVIVMSFNVWFGAYKTEERQKCLLGLLVDIKPHIFCFQEVTNQWLQTFEKNAFIQQNYIITDISSDLCTIGSYGVFIGVNRHAFDVLDVKLCNLPSGMGRKLLSVHVKHTHSAHQFWINTVHLESKANTETRIKQLRLIFDQYMPAMKQLGGVNGATVMLMGDLNFRDNQTGKSKNLDVTMQGVFEENDHLNGDMFIDCWMQYAASQNIDLATGWTRRVGYRYDRILMNIASPFRIQNFNILGNAEEKMPSDHKGVVVFLKQ